MENQKYLSFGEALEELEKGNVVSRYYWSGNLFIIKQNFAEIDKETIPKMQSLPNSAKKLLNKLDIKICYENQFIILCKEGRITSYLPNSYDLCAYDWYVVETNN